MSFVQEKKEI